MLHALNAAQTRVASSIFADFAGKRFLPANKAYRDQTRKARDKAVLLRLLALPESTLESLDLPRLKWSAEPNVHGGKRTRPPGSVGE